MSYSSRRHCVETAIYSQKYPFGTSSPCFSGFIYRVGDGVISTRAMPLLFSYGTLQQESVQLSTFGRRLNGHKDELPRFEQSLVRIEDPKVVATIGLTHHANVNFNGNEDSRVSGMVFEITDAELASVDEYEAAFQYRRVAAALASHRQAWVYVHAQGAADA